MLTWISKDGIIQKRKDDEQMERKPVLLYLSPELLESLDEIVEERKEKERGISRTQLITLYIMDGLGFDEDEKKEMTPDPKFFSIKDMLNRLKHGEAYTITQLGEIAGVTRKTILKMLEMEGDIYFKEEKDPGHKTKRLFIFDSGEEQPAKKKGKRKGKRKTKKRFADYSVEEQNAYYERKHKELTEGMDQEEIQSAALINEQVIWMKDVTDEEMLIYYMKHFYYDREVLVNDINACIKSAPKAGRTQKTYEELIPYVDHPKLKEIAEKIEPQLIDFDAED